MYLHVLTAPNHQTHHHLNRCKMSLMAERLLRSKDPFWALLEWRNTPTVGLDASPNQRFLARRTRGAIPMATNKLLPEVQENMQNKKIHRQEVIQNRMNSCREHLPLQVGQPVLVQDMLPRKTQWNRGICVDRLSDRSYIIDVDGRILRRNRTFLHSYIHVHVSTCTYSTQPPDTSPSQQVRDESNGRTLCPCHVATPTSQPPALNKLLSSACRIKRP